MKLLYKYIITRFMKNFLSKLKICNIFNLLFKIIYLLIKKNKIIHKIYLIGAKIILILSFN